MDLGLFYCDTATFGYQPSAISRCVDYFGPERVMWGTDSPMDMADPGHFHDTAKRSVEDGVGGDERVKGMIMGGNAMRILGRETRERLEGGRGGKL